MSPFHLFIIFVLICRSQLVITTTVPGCENCGCCVDKVCAGAYVQGGFRDDVCTYGCIAGIGWNKCHSKCPDDCVTCEQTVNNNCATCKDSKYLNETRRCVDCPKQCAGLCSSFTGYCEACDGNFHGNLCNECSLGYYGEICDKDCPEHCSLCHRSNGTCRTCNQNYAGPDCDDCVAGRYGPTCEVSCPSTKCSNNICDRETGNCVTCPNGLYGFQCGFSCSPGCNGYICDYESGDCFQCRKPYTGDKCCLAGGHCRTCSSNTVCETCDDGYFGKKCDVPCSTVCANGAQYSQCEKDSGSCSKCLNGFHGDYCNMTCSERCANNRCDKVNGHCTEGCSGDYQGPTCTQVDDTARIIGIAIGVSTAIIVVVIIVLIFVFLFILRRWKRTNQLGKEEVEASYVNTELQSVTPKPQEIAQTQHEYEGLGTRNQKDDTEYEELK